MKEYVIEEDAWDCIWDELIIKKKGIKTFLNRGNVTEVQYNFGEEMLEEMLHELDRLILKYGSDEWNAHFDAHFGHPLIHTESHSRVHN